MYYSQAGQDKWVLDQIPSGYFVDVGAHDGIVSSNTYALERAGWTGLCIEANPSVYKTLTFNRQNCCNRVVSDKEGTLGFYVDKVAHGGIQIHCSRLVDILDEIAAPSVIDYLSVDVEGHELNVLVGMDFSRYQVNLITIEHNLYMEGPSRKQEIFTYLTKQGFVRVKEDVLCLDPNYYNLPYEDWYAHSVYLAGRT